MVDFSEERSWASLASDILLLSQDSELTLGN